MPRHTTSWCLFFYHWALLCSPVIQQSLYIMLLWLWLGCICQLPVIWCNEGRMAVQCWGHQWSVVSYWTWCYTIVGSIRWTPVSSRYLSLTSVPLHQLGRQTLNFSVTLLLLRWTCIQTNIKAICICTFAITAFDVFLTKLHFPNYFRLG